MTESDINQLPMVIKKMEEAIVGIKKVQLEVDEWKNRALRAERENDRLIEKNKKIERTIAVMKSRDTRAQQQFADERDPADASGSRVRPSSRLAPRALSPQGNDEDTDGDPDMFLNELDDSKNDDDFLLEFDGGDSCTFLVSDQEESLLSEIPIEKKITTSDRRRSKKVTRKSVDPRERSRLNSKSNSKRFDDKRKKGPTPDNGDSSDENSSVEAMNILNGYLELRGQYDVSGRKNSRRDRGFN